MSDSTPIKRALELAKRRGMNQARFADALDKAGLAGTLPQHITNWKRRGLPPEHLQVVAKVLKCSVDELLGNAPIAAASLDWPFGFDQDRWIKLLPIQRRKIEEVVERMVEAYEASRPVPTPKSGAARRAGKQRRAAG